MKRRYILLLLSLLTVMVHFSSCDQSIDNFYTEKPRIQFEHYEEDTILLDIRRKYFDKNIFSFGMSADAVKEDTARIVVEFLGEVSDKDRAYTVRIDADSTTAIEGVHYKPFSAKQIFRAGLRKDTLKIVALRSQLSSSFVFPEDRRLVLDLEESEDFNLGLVGGVRTRLDINNYLSKPKWWDDPLRSALGFYHPKKWKILIGFNPLYSDKDNCVFDTNNNGRAYMRDLARYLEGEPTFDDETGARIYIDRMVLQN